MLKVHLLAGAEHFAMAPQLPLVDFEEGLLRADDAARAADADVRDRLLRREAVVLHDVAADQHACARESRLGFNKQLDDAMAMAALRRDGMPEVLYILVPHRVQCWLVPCRVQVHQQFPVKHQQLLTCAAEAGLAVDGHTACLPLTDVQEAQHDVVGGAAAVREVQVVVLEASVPECLPLVQLQQMERHMSTGLPTELYLCAHHTKMPANMRNSCL